MQSYKKTIFAPTRQPYVVLLLLVAVRTRLKFSVEFLPLEVADCAVGRVLFLNHPEC